MRTQNEQTAHTPGPWHIVPQAMDADTERHAMACNPYAFRRHIATHPDLDDPECHIVADMRDGPDGDARLIAAAPDLLAALEALLSERYACESIMLDAEGKPEEFDANGNWTCNSPASVAARAAIAKARGGA